MYGTFEETVEDEVRGTGVALFQGRPDGGAIFVEFLQISLEEVQVHRVKDVDVAVEEPAGHFGVKRVMRKVRAFEKLGSHFGDDRFGLLLRRLCGAGDERRQSEQGKKPSRNREKS